MLVFFRYFSSIPELRSYTTLPPIEAFYNSLTEDHISLEDYEYAHKVWKLFDVKSMAGYTMLYCYLDTILLSESFENFRTFSMTQFHVDPSYYIGIPGLRYFNNIIIIYELHIFKSFFFLEVI